jgi:hypothetical protein
MSNDPGASQKTRTQRTRAKANDDRGVVMKLN